MHPHHILYCPASYKRKHTAGTDTTYWTRLLEGSLKSQYLIQDETLRVISHVQHCTVLDTTVYILQYITYTTKYGVEMDDYSLCASTIRDTVPHSDNKDHIPYVTFLSLVIQQPQQYLSRADSVRLFFTVIRCATQ